MLREIIDAEVAQRDFVNAERMMPVLKLATKGPEEARGGEDLRILAQAWSARCLEPVDDILCEATTHLGIHPLGLRGQQMLVGGG